MRRENMIRTIMNHENTTEKQIEGVSITHAVTIQDPNEVMKLISV
jgi:hypothetical protein